MNRDFDIDEGWYFNFYSRSKQLRVDAGLSLPQLSKLCGISSAAISLIETGKRSPSLKTAIAISQALNISLDVYAGLREYPEEEYLSRTEITILKQKINQVVRLLTNQGE